MKSAGPLLGYNNNIPHKGQIYHVQTEDSGAKRPHVITHLFADGGRIVKTIKTSYEELVGSENLAEKVRDMMREQHKRMVVALRDGELEDLLEQGAQGETATAPTPAAGTPRSETDAAAAPPPPEPPPPAAVSAEASPSTPIELLERAAVAQQDRETPEEEVLVAPVAAPSPSTPPGTSPGGYSFVGTRSSPPPAKKGRGASGAGRRPSGGPSRALRRSAGARDSDAPPASEVAGRPRRRRSRPPGLGGVEVPASHRATMPDPDVAAAHAAHGFGARFISDRRFDEVVLAFLERESMIEG